MVRRAGRLFDSATVDEVVVWRGRFGDPVEPLGPLPGVRIGDVLVYEWRLPEAFIPWPGRTQLERAYVLLDIGVSVCDPLWREAHMPGGRRVPGVGSLHDDHHTWYVDLVTVDQRADTYWVRDLFIDVIVPSDGRPYRTLDLDEFADAMSDGVLTVAQAADALRRWQMFLDRHLHSEREASGEWTDFPPAAIRPLQELAAPLGPVVSYEF